MAEERSTSIKKGLSQKTPTKFPEYKLQENHKAVSMAVFHENRQRLVRAMKEKHAQIADDGGIILLEGGKQETRYSSDTDVEFRQESFFYWAFGVRDADCYGWIDLTDGSAGILAPFLPEAYKVWMGTIRQENHYLDDYGVEEVALFTGESDDPSFVSFFNTHKNKTIYRLSGENSDSKITHAVASHPFMETEQFANLDVKVDDSSLWIPFVECRVIKSEMEMDLLRHATKISSEAHREIMKTVKPGMSEFEMEALFKYHVYKHGGCRHVAYTCICGSGMNGAILHYGHAGEPNSKVMKDGDMLLYDMGAEYHCYCSDITCSYPLNGKFTADQKIVYQAVYNAWKGVTDALKEGVEWPEMHKLAEREILTHLKKHNLIKGNVDDMMAARFGSLFMPHGLGHFIGHDVHDIGGYHKELPESATRSAAPGLRSLRTSRTMKAGMAITIEPGCYFVWSIIEQAAQNVAWSEFLNMDELIRFKEFGGVRIESDVLVHKESCEDMCEVPRTIEEIEEFMKENRESQEKSKK